MLPKFLEMQREFAEMADFAVVYLEEAHPTDGWLYGQVKHLTKQPTTLAQRCAMAQILADELKFLRCPKTVPVCVDRMDNAASHAFGAIPERLIILKGDKVQFVGGAGPSGYSIPLCIAALKKLV